MDKLLYRGVNLKLYEELDGELHPKEAIPFTSSPEFEVAEFGNSYWGENEENEVIKHQLHQEGIPTSGISTTPILERAKFYATKDGCYDGGIIYVIDTKLCIENNVQIYIVNEIVPNPSVPEDEEIILVASDFGSLPKSIVVREYSFKL